MTPAEIRAAIAADPNILALVPDFEAIAAALSVGRKRVESRLGGVGVVMESLGAEDGAAVLDALDALRAVSSPVKWAWVLIERGELDFGSAATRGMIKQLALAGAIPAAAETALLAISEVADPVTAAQVEIACKSDTGELIV